jgi:hypothetical protein
MGCLIANVISNDKRIVASSTPKGFSLSPVVRAIAGLNTPEINMLPAVSDGSVSIIVHTPAVTSISVGMICDLPFPSEDPTAYRGVFIQALDGQLYSVGKWANQKTPNGVAVITDDCSFVIALKDASPGYCVWGTRSNIAGVNNSDAKNTVKTYYNGEDETNSIITNASNSTAATYCKDFTFPNGQSGYMGAGGEWWTALTHKAEIIAAMNACGGVALSKDYWCTTEQVGSNRAWAADWEGADLTNYNKTASSSVKARAFCKLIL